jgi:hypothetical protein
VEAGSDTSTVAARVVGGDKKGSLESQIVKYGREAHGTRTRQRMRWRGPAAIVHDRPILSLERILITTMTAGVQLRKRNLAVSLQGLGAKTNRLAVNRQS